MRYRRSRHPTGRDLAAQYLVSRLFGPPRRHGRRYGYGYGYGRQARGRGGWGMRGPFPTYSRRTRGGSRVTVTGCCLPIPLALTLGAAAYLPRVRRKSR
jgi:hypothetical protein